MRQPLVLLHRYAGLLLGVFLLLSGLTGTLLVFRDAIEVRSRPQVHSVAVKATNASWKTIQDSVKASAPEDRIAAAFLPLATGRTIEIRFRQDPLLRVYVNPYTGHVVARETATDSPMGFLWELHAHLLNGKTGGKVMGWAGIGLLILSLIGLWLWWPRKGRWKSALSIKKNAAAVRFWLDVHRVSGAVLALLLTVTALTGAGLALPEVTRTALQAVTGHDLKQAPPKVTPSGEQLVPLETLLAAARQHFPKGQITRLSFPAKATDALGVRMRLEGEVHQFGRTFLWFDPFTGQLIRADNALTANPALQLHAWIFPLHTGVWGGLLAQVLQVVVGLSLPLFVLTGVWLWWKGVKARSLARTRVR